MQRRSSSQPNIAQIPDHPGRFDVDVETELNEILREAQRPCPGRPAEEEDPLPIGDDPMIEDTGGQAAHVDGIGGAIRVESIAPVRTENGSIGTIDANPMQPRGMPTQYGPAASSEPQRSE